MVYLKLISNDILNKFETKRKKKDVLHSLVPIQWEKTSKFLIP